MSLSRQTPDLVTRGGESDLHGIGSRSARANRGGGPEPTGWSTRHADEVRCRSQRASVRARMPRVQAQRQAATFPTRLSAPCSAGALDAHRAASACAAVQCRRGCRVEESINTPLTVLWCSAGAESATARMAGTARPAGRRFLDRQRRQCGAVRPVSRGAGVARGLIARRDCGERTAGQAPGVGRNGGYVEHPGRERGAEAGRGRQGGSGGHQRRRSDARAAKRRAGVQFGEETGATEAHGRNGTYAGATEARKCHRRSAPATDGPTETSCLF